MPVTEIICTACGVGFSFTEEEQAFYESKGFQPPRKCKPCRDAAKANRGGSGGGYGGGSRGGYGGGGYGGGGSRGPRQMYDAVCASCGCNTQVPFQPNGSKPVYCRDCFQSQSAY
ncbi:MAG: CxxC-x17-CxxC domain-containing protein [Candidatus Melainabacteria bacterium]